MMFFSPQKKTSRKPIQTEYLLQYISKTGKAYINAIETETNHILSIYGRDNTINFINAAIKDNRILDGDKKRADKLQNILGIMLSLPDNILSINSTSSIRQTEEKSQQKN